MTIRSGKEESFEGDDKAPVVNPVGGTDAAFSGMPTTAEEETDLAAMGVNSSLPFWIEFHNYAVWCRGRS